MEVARYDVAVAGGGPAGCAAAITAARMGLRVLLLEQGQFPRHKVCGEFVSAESLALLHGLLAQAPGGLEILERAPRIERARMFLPGTMVQIAIAPSASIPRFALDAALWRAAGAVGVDCRTGVTVDSISAKAVASSAGTFACDRAIAATGRWSKLRQPVARANARKLIGVKAHYREEKPSWSTDLYFFRGGYCGVQPVDDETVNVSALVEAEVACSLDEIFELHPGLEERSSKWTRATEPVTTAPLIFAEPQPERDGVLFAGDAAGFIDPFAGDGISLALRTGRAAAQAKSSSEYRRIYEQNFMPAFRAAAQARWVIGCPRPVPQMAAHLLRMPGVARVVFAKTRGL